MKNPTKPLWLAAPAMAAAVALFALPARADTLSDLEAPFREALASGNWAFALALIFLAGVATSLTPCVYPMIVITVSVFGAMKAKSRMHAALLSTSFVLGIAALFTPLGLFAATTGELFGSALSNPIVLWTIAGLLIALSLGMMGAFTLDLPSGLKTRLATVGGVGYKGAFALGFASAIIASPCTGPVLGFLLTWVGTTGNVVFGAVSLFVYALGLGLLFFLVGTFSLSLPKSGNWLDWFKSFFGIVMIVAAIYFVRDLIPGLNDVAERTPTFLGIGFAIVVVGFAMGAIHLSFHDPSIFRRIRKAAGVLVSIVGFTALMGYCQALPPGAKLEWNDDYKTAKKAALDGGKPFLVDFTASWCGACHELDRHTFSDPRVVREGRRFVSARVDMSPNIDTPEKRAILAGYKQVGLPLVVLHDSTGKEAARITSFTEADKFLEMMKRVK